MNIVEITNELYGSKASEITNRLAREFSSVTGFNKPALSFLQRSQISKAVGLIEKGDNKSLSEAKNIVAKILEINPQSIADYSGSQLLQYINSEDSKAYQMKRIANSLLSNGYDSKIVQLYQSGLEDKINEVQSELSKSKANQEEDYKMDGLRGRELEQARRLNAAVLEAEKAQISGSLVAQYLSEVEVDEELPDTGKLGDIKKYHQALQYVNELTKQADKSGKIELTPENLALYANVVKAQTNKEVDIKDALARARIGGLTTKYLAMDQRVLHKRLYELTKGNISEYVKTTTRGVDNYARLAEISYFDKKQSQQLRDVEARAA